MILQENVGLRKLNSFSVQAKARKFTEVYSIDGLKQLKASGFLSNNSFLILGGGSNILFTSDFNGLVIRINLKGITIEGQDDRYVYVRAMAGEDWPDFVSHCVKNGWGGIENLTMIPGNVGTSPIQNIGAYGVELKDIFHDLLAFDLESGELRTFNLADCNFGYRESFFKNEGKGRFVIVSVCFRLTRNNHQLAIHYGPVSQLLEGRGNAAPTPADVMQVIQSIRKSKLPDPAELGNAGSFFKNPVISAEKYKLLASQFPEMPFYPAGEGYVKLAAAWLIDQAGWKGHREGDAGVHQKQALVIVNYGNASGRQLFELSEKIRNSVNEKFGVLLEREVNVI